MRSRQLPDLPRPARMVVDGVPLLVMVPPLTEPPEPAASMAAQPPLPIELDDAPDDEVSAQLARAEAFVARLAHATAEILGRRRPAAQLRGTIDDESLSVLAAWARLGCLTPTGLTRPRLEVSSPTRIEGWFGVLAADRLLVAVVTLERTDRRWTCTTLRVLAPDGLRASHAA